MIAVLVARTDLASVDGDGNGNDAGHDLSDHEAAGRAFIPPAPYPQKANPGEFWYGTPKLWTQLRADGTWKGLPHYTPDDPTFRQKLFWWRQGYDVPAEPYPKLKITGKRLDSSAPAVLLADHASNGWQQPEQPFMVVGINVPTLGCWEITGQYQDAQVTYVVWVTE
jgi:hypothetical protein